MFPYLDVDGVKLRSILRSSYFTDVDTQTPGYTAQSIATNSSTINSQMRKRYGGILPWGQSPPVLVAAGANRPVVSLSGRPTLGSYLIRIEITTAGVLGAAIFQWSATGGAPWTTAVATAASVLLGTTGMSALFPDDTYATTDVYAAAPPVPETLLQWLTALVTEDVSIKHGINPNDPLSEHITKRATLAREQLEAAANTKDGLWDLPISEDLGSAVDTGGPRGYSEQSPYTWQYRQQEAAAQESAAGSGTFSPNRLVGG